MESYIRYEKWTFPADKIMSGNLYLASSLLATSLEPNTFTPVVECDDPAIMAFERNTPLLYYEKPDQPMVFRVQSIERIAPKLYQVSSSSTLGLLCEGLHYGGIYTGEEAEEVIASICGTVPFIVKSALKHTKLYGYLPIAVPRDNLSQVLFALGATLKTDLDGVLRIEGFWDGISRAVGPERMYIESTVKYAAVVTDVSVTEHQYREGSEEKQLFEGTTLEGDIIKFSEPIHSLTAHGFTILDHGANWAKLSAGSGTLNGKAYAHSTREVTRHIQDAATPNIKTVSDATLISLVNSQAAANRLANFYQWRETVDIPMIYHGEQPGDRIAGFHPFDRAGTNYCLQSADITLSNTLKAQTKGLVGFVPLKIEDVEYRDVVEVILEDGEWTAREDGEIIVVLIGGGQGGWSGREGADAAGSGSGAPGGVGGAGGVGGDGGKIYQFSLEVKAGDRFQVIIGKGGNSGGYLPGFDIPPFDPGPWTWSNGDTVFGEFTSASGASDPNGFLEVLTNTVYARQGSPGTRGGDGGKSGYVGAFAGSEISGSDGDSVIAPDTEETYPGGKGGSSVGATLIGAPPGDPFAALAYGGGGGGAAVGESGKNGTSGYVLTTNSVGGSGGAGGSAAKQPEKPSIRGTGGTGGHGGGGGGAGGSALAYGGGGTVGAPGKGGAGTKGGEGADGAVIIYYGAKVETASGQLVGKNGRMILDRFGRSIIM